MEDAIDRVRAQSRVDFVTRMLRDLKIESVCAYSTTMLDAAQALDNAEREDITKKIRAICAEPPEDLQLKQYRLGFLLLNRMGEDFVTMLVDKAPASCRAAAERSTPEAENVLNRFNPFAQKEETVFYFAFERDMMGTHMIERLGWTGMPEKEFKMKTSPQPAKLPHHKVIYNVPNGTGADLNGLPNLAPDPGEEVEGILYKLNKNCVDFLASQRPDFNQDILPVIVDDKPVEAVVYVAKHTSTNLRANSIVAQAVVAAAERSGLSVSYITKLQKLVPAGS